MFLSGIIYGIISFAQINNKVKPGYLISNKSSYLVSENKKDSYNPGKNIIALNLESDTAANNEINIAKINLLLNEALNNICKQINENQKESTKNDDETQESEVDSTNSLAEESQDQNLNYMETQLLLSINNIRTQNGLQMLNPNQTLMNIAYSRSQDMINRGYFSHNTPEGKSIFDILIENGAMYAYAGENLYNCTPPSMGSPEIIINTWLESGSHRANIFNPNYSQVGIRVVDGGNRRVVTAIFLN
ncbi:MAG TPA: CAP domain-containing protein [Candidatus Hydromicrobium sp.]